MSLLTMIQGVAPRLGIPKPSSVVGNNDQQIIQLLEIAQEEGKVLSKRFPWSAMVKEHSFTITAAEDQGAINSTVVSAGDFDYMLPETFWNRTTTLPLHGPLSPSEWETRKALGISGPFPAFMIRGNRLYLNPTPTVGTETGAFEYKSKNWCESNASVGQSSWAKDSDTGLLNETTMEQGIIWRWKMYKGLDYGEEMMTYERFVTDDYARDGSRKVLNAGGRINNIFPAIGIPPGTWNVS